MALDSTALAAPQAGVSGLAQIGAGSSHARPTNAKEAATQFEGLLIEEMLRSAHAASPGSLSGSDDEDAESSTVFDLAAEQFAQMMARQGGFGIAHVVTAGLARRP